ncbi:hypothetical protein MSG28_012029 [Choristoneura fumiferana]|uniref:Uncharacterized protein n=1 Tax=Choristoneura fumiferana TaxID=7141 RepID=A0ACC0KMX7_CHOFU|nr:hypothetical protein MSG28_012029 [Choristoneura fumiferana]
MAVIRALYEISAPRGAPVVRRVSKSSCRQRAAAGAPHRNPATAEEVAFSRLMAALSLKTKPPASTIPMVYITSSLYLSLGAGWWRRLGALGAASDLLMLLNYVLDPLLHCIVCLYSPEPQDVDGVHKDVVLPARDHPGPARTPTLDLVQPPALGSARTPTLDLVQPPALGPARTPTLDLVQPPALGSARTPVLGPARTPTLDLVRPPALGSARTPALGPARTPTLDLVRPPALGSARTPALGPVEPTATGTDTPPLRESSDSITSGTEPSFPASRSVTFPPAYGTP